MGYPLCLLKLTRSLLLGFCVHGSQPDAVQLAFTLTIPTQINVRLAERQPEFSFLLRQLFAWMKQQSRSGSRIFNLSYNPTLIKGRNPLWCSSFISFGCFVAP